MGNKYIMRNCYWCHEYQDMNAIVPTCDYYGQYGSCPCSDDCEHYIDEQEAENIIRRSKKGQWEYCKHAGISDVWKCNQCGAWMFGKTNFCPNCGAIMKDGENEVYNMAIEALSEPRGDLISREDAIDAICKSGCYVTYMDCPHADDGFRCDGCDDIEAIKALPSADRPKGEWVDRSDGGRITYPWWESCECNQCGEYGSGAYNYCPNCGAEMKGGDSE